MNIKKQALRFKYKLKRQEKNLIPGLNLSRFKEEYNHKNRREAIIKASATTGNAILSAGLTTFAGFFPLSFSRVGIISQFGAISAFNVAAAIVLTLIIFPLILNWVPDKFINK